MKKLFSFLLAGFLIVSVSATDIRISSIRMENHTERLDYTGYYPELRGILDKQSESDLNVSFRELEQKARKYTELLAKKNMSDRKSEGKFEYAVTRNCGSIMSILFTNYVYWGGAHGGTEKIGRTFNTETGKVYSLKSLFKPDTDYVTAVSDEIIKQMKARKLNAALLKPFVKISRNQNFYLTDKNLVIYFGEYEYFPYAYSIQEFPISLQSLNGILNPEIQKCK